MNQSEFWLVGPASAHIVAREFVKSIYLTAPGFFFWAADSGGGLEPRFGEVGASAMAKMQKMRFGMKF